MPVFPLLLRPERYRPCDWDLLADAPARAHWLGVFLAQIPTLRAAALESGYPHQAVERVCDRLREGVEALRRDPRALGDRLDILALDVMRETILREEGVDDPFRAVKARETERALAQLPARLAQLDEAAEEALPGLLVEGVFAGNLFDLGAPATAAAYEAREGPSFEALLARARTSRLLIDDRRQLRLQGWRKAILFADNAGADVVLGLLPLARALAQRSCLTILAANELPALNDVTAQELRSILDRCQGLLDAELRVVSTGAAEPLLDLCDVSPELCEASEGAELLVFVGMGRALESNWQAAFDAVAWRLAVIKDEAIARRRGGRLYDGVCSVAQRGCAPLPVASSRSGGAAAAGSG